MPKILLVEDDPMISEIYQKKFQTSGFEVVPATTGKQVLEKAKADRFDLVLLDLILPEMDGMEILRELRTGEAYPKDMKIVIFSNLNEKSDREKALALGANGFIPKADFTPTKLIEEVTRLIQQFAEQDKHSGAAPAPAPASAGSGKSILFIEDEKVFMEMFGKRLEEEGYRVTYTESGETGLQKALAEPFDLIVTDGIVKQLDGRDVIQKLRENEATRQVPIFLFSASLDEAELRRMASEGATRSFLKTELTPTDLVRNVNEVLGGASA